MPIEDTSNSYEYKLKQAGLAEPLSTYLSDPNDPDRLAAGFVSAAKNSVGNVVGLNLGGKVVQSATLQSGTRRGLLIVGNSISGQSGRNYPLYTSNITASEVRAGSYSIQLVAGGVTALALSVNDTVAIGLCNQQTWTTKVLGIAGEVLTLEKPLPRLLRASAGVSKVTTPNFLPSVVRQGVGIFSLANAMLGAPLELLPVHGHGGGLASEIIEALPGLLAFYRPAVVAFHLFENDLPNASISVQALKDIADNAARLCFNYDATPIFATCLPTTSIAANRAAAYDEMEAYVMNLPNKFPGAYAVNPGAIYIDKTNPTIPRQPLAGWTDGVHPNTSKRPTIAFSVLPIVKEAFGSSVSNRSALFGVNTTLSGTGGTASNLVGGSVVPASTTITANAGVTCATSKTATDALAFDMSIAGASNISSTQMLITQSFTHPKTWGPNTLVKLVARFYVESISNVAILQLSHTYGSIVSGFQEQDWSLDPALNGKEFTIETVAIPYRNAATLLSDITFAVRPSTLSSPSNVSFKGELREIGFEVVPQGEMIQ